MENKVEKYYDFNDLAKDVESEIGHDPEVVKEIIKSAFEKIAQAVGKGENLVVLDDIGTFRLRPAIARTYKTRSGKDVEKDAYLKLRFKGSIKLRQIVKAHLRQPIKQLEVK
jgi:nucleoid DNA-binding protein